ncbi:MAG: protein kinase [Deltaproteobacteria bacterium]|nr:protein kinase [Deltaproteobacteria bacterium]
MPEQTCPNCGTGHDVSIFVTGQRVRCTRCGIRFDVQRSDISMGRPTAEQRARAPENGKGTAVGEIGRAPPPPPPVPLEAESAPRSDEHVTEGPTDAEVAGESFANDETRVRAGLAIPGFDVLRTLGRGGMGEVYLAQQQSLARQVALKVLAPELARSEDFVARFEKEAAALASLSHPNIVGIIDRGEAEGTYYFAMEFVEGPSLRDLLREGPLAPTRAVEIIAQVCAAIDYAHSKGVIHRDLKPENILIDPHGVVKVADFGLAGIIGGDERLHLTRTDMAMGTFHYMAPEQRKSARDVDARADLFSLGVMLYELLCGEVPAGVFKLPSKRIEGLDERVDAIVTRAMEANPADRYQRASAIFADLQQVAESSRLTSTPMKISGPATAADRPRARARSVEGESELSLSTVDSVLERTGRGLKRTVQILIFGLAVAAVLVFVLVGQEGRRAISTGLTTGLGGELTADGGGGELPREVVHHQESPMSLPVKMRLDGDERVEREFDFVTDTSGEMPWFLYRGYWVHEAEALVQDVFMGGAGLATTDRMPRAFLGDERFFADGFRLESSVVLSSSPGPEVPLGKARALVDALESDESEPVPTAKLYLYRNKRHFFALEVSGGESGGYRLSWNLEDGERFGTLEGGTGLPEAAGREALRLALWIEGGWLYGSVEGKEIGRAQLGDLTEENWGKVGFGCQDARCIFDDALIVGKTRPPPRKDEKGQTGPGVEPIER